jgi:hypothetical protein
MDISGSNYQILNSVNSVIYRSTSSSTAFNWLLGNGGYAGSGSTVYVKSGAYSVDHTWNIYVSGVTVTFQVYSKLTAVPFGNFGGGYYGEPVMLLYGDNIVIDGTTIDGNGINQYPSQHTYLSTYFGPPYSTDINLNAGITVAGNNCLIKNSEIYNCRRDGIDTYWQSTGTLGIVNCKVHEVGANGIDIAGLPIGGMGQPSPAHSGHPNSYIVNCEVYHVGDCAIVTGSLDCKVTGNYIHEINAVWCNSANGMFGCQAPNYGGSIGIASEYAQGSGNGNYHLIANNTIVGCVGGGIWIFNGADPASGNSQNYLLISGNTLTDCADSYGWVSAIQLYYSSYCIISYNTISVTSPSNYVGIGIQYNGGNSGKACVGNNVYGNSFTNCATNIANYGTGTTYTRP